MHKNDIKTQNKQAIKDYLRENDNPILNSIKAMIKTVGKNGNLPADYKINMLPPAIIALVDPIMQEKCWVDLDKEKGNLSGRKPQ